MARGKGAEVGTTRVSANGYQYTKVGNSWRLSHHLVAEQTLGRPLSPDERVRFLSKNKLDLSEKNIEVVLKGKSSLRRRKAILEARIEELKAELADVNTELNSQKLR